jgi:large subunit ribosomal protein L13
LETQTRYYKSSDLAKKWHLVDANGKTLGRLATQVAGLLRGKHTPLFTPNADLGDFVVVVNAEKVRMTGKREELKRYFRHSGYPGGVTLEKFQDLMAKHPERVVENAVRGMLPHNKLGRKIFGKLKVYKGAAHPHAAQNPVPYSIHS